MKKKKETPKEEKKTSLLRTIFELNKRYGSNTINYVDKMENIAIKRIPSGIPKLDEAVGGGWPLGRILELYGLYSSGKSLIAQKIVAGAQREGLETVWVDVEGTFDPIFAQSLGVDTDKVALMQVGIGEGRAASRNSTGVGWGSFTIAQEAKTKRAKKNSLGS